MYVGSRFSSTLLVDVSDVHLAQGDFTRSLIGLRAAYFFTPRLSVQTLTQYNDQAHVWTANTRLSWLNTAGTGLFVVFNDLEQAEGYFDWKRPQTRVFTVKFTKQFGTGGERTSFRYLIRCGWSASGPFRFFRSSM